MSSYLSAVFFAARDVRGSRRPYRAAGSITTRLIIPRARRPSRLPVVSPRARRLPRYFKSTRSRKPPAAPPDLENPPDKLTGQRQTSEIIECLNICDYTHQVSNDVEEPLFQPFLPNFIPKCASQARADPVVQQRLRPPSHQDEDPRSRHDRTSHARKKGEKLREETEEVIKAAPGWRLSR